MKSDRPQILACGLGTELERRGYTNMLKSRLWSALALVECPDLLRSIHYDQFRSGVVQLVSSCSYQASLEAFRREFGAINEQQVEEWLRLSVRLVRQAADQCSLDPTATATQSLRVVASCGTYAAYLANGAEYTGDFGGNGVTVETLMAFHERRLRCLLKEHPDLVAFETIPSVLEVEALCRMLSTATNIELIERSWLSLSCRDEQRLNDGTAIEECLALIDRLLPAHCRLFAVGVNCTPPQFAPGIVARIAKHPASAHRWQNIICYPNSGEQWDAVGRCWLPGTRQDFMGCMLTAHQAGATILGGCCRVTLEDLRQLTKSLF